MSPRRKSLARRIMGYLLGYVVVLFLILWFFQVHLLPTLYNEYRRQQAIEKVEEMGARLDTLSFSRYVTGTAREETACIRVVRLSGTEILSLDFMPYCDLHNLSPAELAALRRQAEAAGGSLARVYTMDSDRLRVLVPSGTLAILYVKVFEAPGGEPTTIFYNSAISPISEMLTVVQTELQWITFSAAVVGVLLALWITRGIVRPIIRISEQARRLKGQDYTVTFDGGGYHEVEELSATLNETSRTLERLDGLRRALISSVSHDLRTPLAKIIAYGEVMRDLPGENTPENVQVVIDEAARLSDLVNRVLIYPETYDVATELVYSDFDLAQMCRQIAFRYQKFSRVDSSTIRYEGPEHLTVWADETRISQAVYNFLNNAESHSATATEICLRVCEDGGEYVRVEVSDNGRGIPAEQQALIWEMHYTGAEGEEYHNGLGLMIVRRIMEQHKAECGLDSAPGSGSTFWFRLRRHRPPAD